MEAPSSAQHLLRILPSTQVDFTTSDPVKRPLPDPRYLELHAACARVAHLSGAAEYIDQILREEEVTKVLAFDGGSSDLLNHILTHRGIVSLKVQSFVYPPKYSNTSLFRYHPTWCIQSFSHDALEERKDRTHKKQEHPEHEE